MPSNYDQIRQDNIREYGEGTRHLSFLGRLYTDRTHFIFELLQNAEDAAASRILFQLFDDRLEVKHNGRIFDERDVRGVSGVGEGTKADDLTQIGKFGIGFKSVYAYTSTPEVHSGDEHFRIDHYVRPYSVAARTVGHSWTTLFVFTFDAPGIDPGTARHEIATRLSNLSARTLLFLRKIKEIEYKLPEEPGGIYLREEVARGSARQVTVIGQNNGEDEDETWLVFQRYVSVPNPREGCPDKVPVEIGFRLETDEKEQIERIEKIKDSPLVVSFPTEKATRFGFLVQGPYKTTPSRDNIPKDDDWNATLVGETAILLTEVLGSLKEMGLLTVALLQALPIRMDDFQEDGMFFPIVGIVRDAFLNQELLPADDGTFVSARTAKLARGAELRKLLSQDQLRSMFQSNDEVKWLAGEITQDRTADLRTYLMDELDVEEITPEGFARKISDSFLTSQQDDWFAAFYEYLSDQEALWRAPRWSSDSGGILRGKPILRLENGSLIVPFDKDDHPTAYLPTEDSMTFPVVRRSITKHKPASDFLKRLGLTEPDDVANVIENILPKYRVDGAVQTDEERYQADLKATFRALKTDSQQKKQHLLEEVQKTPFVKSINAATGEVAFKRPGEVYLPTEDMLIYLAGNQAAWLTDRLIYEQYRDGAMQIGVAGDVRVSCRKPYYLGGNIELKDWHGWHERALHGFDPEAKIDGLEYALSNPDLERSRLIWNSILAPNMHLLKGFVEKATRQDYSNSQREERLSLAGRLVVENAWIIGRDDICHIPSDITLADLPDDWLRNEDLARQLAMKPLGTQDDYDDLEKMAAKFGVKPDYLELARNNPEEFANWCEGMKSRSTSRPSFPVKPVHDPARRHDRFSEQFEDAPEKEYEQRERSGRTTRGAIDPDVRLRNEYTNDEHQMICQMCEEEMPFRKRDGEYYFETVEALSRDYFAKEDEAQFLALCPLCAAIYKEFVKRDDSAMEVLKTALLNSEQLEVSLCLEGRKISLRFVERHHHDIKFILRASQ